MATLYLDPQSDGVTVSIGKGRKTFPATSSVADIIDYMLGATRGQATPAVDSLGVSTEAKAAILWAQQHQGPGPTITIGPPDPKLRRAKPKRVSITLDELLS